MPVRSLGAAVPPFRPSSWRSEAVRGGRGADTRTRGSRTRCGEHASDRTVNPPCKHSQAGYTTPTCLHSDIAYQLCWGQLWKEDPAPLAWRRRRKAPASFLARPALRRLLPPARAQGRQLAPAALATDDCGCASRRAWLAPLGFDPAPATPRSRLGGSATGKAWPRPSASHFGLALARTAAAAPSGCTCDLAGRLNTQHTEMNPSPARLAIDRS